MFKFSFSSTLLAVCILTTASITSQNIDQAASRCPPGTDLLSKEDGAYDFGYGSLVRRARSGSGAWEFLGCVENRSNVVEMQAVWPDAYIDHHVKPGRATIGGVAAQEPSIEVIYGPLFYGTGGRAIDDVAFKKPKTLADAKPGRLRSWFRGWIRPSEDADLVSIDVEFISSAIRSPEGGFHYSYSWQALRLEQGQLAPSIDFHWDADTIPSDLVPTLERARLSGTLEGRALFSEAAPSYTVARVVFEGVEGSEAGATPVSILFPSDMQ